MDYKLVDATDIEHLTVHERTYQFHAAQLALEEENGRHASKVHELEQFIWQVKANIPASDHHSSNAATIRKVILDGGAPDVTDRIAKMKAAKNPAPAGSASPAA
jgi:hypothetical protein